MKRILVVEDDSTLAASMVQGLKAEPFEVELCVRGDIAYDKALSWDPDLIILDLMLPGNSGHELLQKWKDRIKVPTIVLTARTELQDRLKSFELGAVDFLPKPFWMEELVARIRTHLRIKEESPKNQIKWADVVLDLDNRQLRRKDKDQKLTGHEFNILAYLAERPNRALSREQIARFALVLHEGVGGRTVDSHMTRMRKKIGKEASKSIETVWGIGYRFVSNEKQR